MCSKLVKLNDDKYTLLINGFDIEGDTHETIARMLMHGFNGPEIELALTEIDKTSASVAHFGINQLFMYTSNNIVK